MNQQRVKDAVLEITEERFAAPHTSASLLASCFHRADRSGEQAASAAQVGTEPTARQLAKARFVSRRTAARDRVYGRRFDGLVTT